MQNFRSFFTEEKKPVAGILHLEHPADRVFDGEAGAKHSHETLKGITNGTTPITRKIDDKMSYHAIRGKDGKVGVKYKGPGASYNYTNSEIDKQHGHKPYLVHPLKALLKHLDKVLPKEEGEYQGGHMSTPETRSSSKTHISHTPNTLEYAMPHESEEGKKLKYSKLSTVIHSKLIGPDKQAKPILNTSKFGEHPDVHLVNHIVTDDERKLPEEDKAFVHDHLKSAEKLMRGHDYAHLEGHAATLRQFINSKVREGDESAHTVKHYKEFLAGKHDKNIAAVKTQKFIDAKTAEKEAAMKHVDKHKEHFDRSLKIHHHLQHATNHLAKALDHASSKTVKTMVDGKDSGGEGFVGNGVKIVDRSPTGFSAANFASGAKFKKLEEAFEHGPPAAHHMTFMRGNPIHKGHELVINQVKQAAEKDKGGHTIVMSHSHDDKKNPLSLDQKLYYARKAFPGTNIQSSSKERPSILHTLSDLHDKGVTHLTLHSGSDRAGEFENLIKRYNGVPSAHGHFNFKKVTMRQAGGNRKNVSDEGIDSASATAMRNFAVAGKSKEFGDMAPDSMSDEDKHEMYNDTRANLNHSKQDIKKDDEPKKKAPMKSFKDHKNETPEKKEFGAKKDA